MVDLAMKLGHSILECFLSNNRRRQRSTAIVKLGHSATRRELAEIESPKLRSDTLRKREWGNEWMMDLRIYIYILKNDRYINTPHLLRVVAPLVWNFQFRGLWFFFLEVIVFFFLLSNLSKNLIPLQKQHPRSVGNRPKKRKSMPYSIILGLGWASSRCSSCSLIPFQNDSSLRIAFGSRNVGVMMIQWEFLTKPYSINNIHCSDGRGMLEIGHFLGPVCWDRSVTRERVLK